MANQLKTKEFLLNQKEIEKHLKLIIKKIMEEPLSEDSIKADKTLKSIYSTEILSKVFTDVVF